MNNIVDNASNVLTVENIGEHVNDITVELSARFLEHFSEQLYSSPNKAFEELISNGWDAGADYVDVRISDDLSAENATMCVLDNGVSMDIKGLEDLWHIAFSPKKNNPTQYGRSIIGKFGIGKLATYVLASKLTYICKASDGKIRRITMDYGAIERKKDEKESLLSNLRLGIYEVTMGEVENVLLNVYQCDQILDIIKKGVNENIGENTSEYGGKPSKLDRPTTNTWTLVVLSDIKPAGKELKIGILKRMLEAALPFGNEMLIRINGEKLYSSKLSVPVVKEWKIGPELEIKEINLEEDEDDDGEQQGDDNKKGEAIGVLSADDPYDYIEIPGIGKVTGTVKLFENKISGGKSDKFVSSNGYHVNIRGRVINLVDNTFGGKNHSHSVWSRFRMAVRADGLDSYLITNREQLRDVKETRLFKAFLRKVFNRVRTFYENDYNISLIDDGDVLVQTLGIVSLNPLRNIVSESLDNKLPELDFFDKNNIDDNIKNNWRSNINNNFKTAISSVKYEKVDDNNFVKYRIKDNTIVINKEHPFVIEHTKSRAEKELVSTIAMVNLLTDVFTLDIGIDIHKLNDIRSYRDKLMCYRSLQKRESGASLVRLLRQVQHDSRNNKRLEVAVSDALKYLGFDIKRLGNSGEPEGIAKAYPYPTINTATKEDSMPPLYSFTFDAKSTKHDKAHTYNLNLDGINEHKKKHRTDYALVIAADFERGDLEKRCATQGVTPMRVEDLGKLLSYTLKYGAISLIKLKEIFEYFDPDLVSKWVDELKDYIDENRTLTFDVFIKALMKLKGKISDDVFDASVIALTCRNDLNISSVKTNNVISLVKGLQILMPTLIGVGANDKIVVNCTPEKLSDAVKSQLELIDSFS